MNKFVVAAGAILLSISVASAHHSGAMYDDTTVVETDATVTGFQWTNPHSWIQVSYTDESGVTKEVDLELGSPIQLAQQGWRPRIVAPGDAVTVRFHPHREGVASGFLNTIKLPDGRELTSE